MPRISLDTDKDHLVTPKHSDARGPVVRGQSIEIMQMNWKAGDSARPHATILAVGTGEERAVVRNGALAVANIMTVTLSTDHWAVDGALGAELLGAFKMLIENPVMMLV